MNCRIVTVTGVIALLGVTAATAEEKYPLGIQLQVLDRDLTSEDYRQVLPTMISTDLAAEWRRVGTPDNYLLFERAHGGRQKVLADPRLAAAWRRRKRIATRYLVLMREAYTGLKRKVPFDDPSVVEAVLVAASRRVAAGATEPPVPVRRLVAVAGAERQWPGFRGPTGQGTVVDSGFPLEWSGSKNVRWRMKLPGRGNSSPVVWNERVFITAESADRADRLLLCLDRADGRVRWQVAAPRPAKPEKLYWKNTYASSTPVTDGERVICFFGNSGLVAFDLDGKRLWQRGLGEFKTSHGPGSSPVLYRDLVILLQDQNRGESVFAAFEKSTGRPVWQRARAGAMCWSTPVLLRVGDHDELVHNGSHQVIAYDPATGRELWRLAGPSREAIPMIASGGGLLYSASGRNGPTLAIRPGGKGDVTATHLAWRTIRGGPHVPSPVFLNGRLYSVSDTGIVSCLVARTGKSLWQRRLRGRFSMSPLAAGDRLLLTSEDGVTTILKDGPTFEVLATNHLGENVLATPAVLGGQIIFRTAEHLLCIGSE